MKCDKKTYDNKTFKGFYEWNKSTFLAKKSDKRYNDLVNEKNKTGISSDETWDLKVNIALFLVPRLKLFKSCTCGYPSNLNNIQEWYDILDKIIFAFETSLQDEDDIPQSYLNKYDEKDSERENKASNDYYNDIDVGLKLFAKYFHDLWW